ncbi:MAG: hypothetical protein RBU37_17940 [Myxococcota bacterium]|jgi:hypothetical protein|nr:hypothetical protein [Myxococcota bacterium]
MRLRSAARVSRERTNENKLGEQVKRPIDKKLGEQVKRPIDKKLGEQAKRPIDKKSGLREDALAHTQVRPWCDV